jgi:predicted amidophosphoribosyltransferase
LCRSQDRRIGRIYAIAYQSGAVRRAIYGYKYGGVTGWPAVFGRLFLAWLDETLAGTPPDLIVAHPSFVGPGGQRFAHTEAVVESAARAARARAAAFPPWQFDTATPRAIIKTAATLKSADMQAWTKRASAVELRAALRVPDPARTSGRHILIYDDVCTTGGQLEAVAACLLDEGFARRVDGVVLGRAPWRGRELADRPGPEV